MNAATHPDREELAAYVLGTLPEDRAERLEEHLAACPACEETIRGMEGLSDPLIEGLGRAGQVEKPHRLVGPDAGGHGFLDASPGRSAGRHGCACRAGSACLSREERAAVAPLSEGKPATPIRAQPLPG